MFFRGRKENSIEQTDDIETLVLRLETSSYIEDKIDALKSIHEYSLIDPISTGTYSLNIVFRTLADLDDISYSLNIILEVLKTSHAMEFTDLVLKNTNNIDVLVKAHEKSPVKVYEILAIMSKNCEFKKKLICCKNISFLLVNELEHDRFEVLKNVIVVLNGDFKKQLIFAGIFEKLLGKLTSYKRWCFDLLEILLTGNHFNQNYFIETNWCVILHYLDSHTQTVFNLLNSLVDKTNNNFQHIRDNVLKFVDLKTCLIKEQYRLAYSMIYNDSNKFKEFIDMYNEVSFTGLLEGIETQSGSSALETDDNNTGLLILLYIIHNNTIKFRSNNKTEYNAALLLLSELLIHNGKHLVMLANRFVVEKKYNFDIREQILKQTSENYSVIYDILTILTIREIDCEFNLQNQIIEIHFALFILFKYDSSKTQLLSNQLLEIIYDDTNVGDLVSICVLICLVHDIRLGFNNEYCLSHLKRVRKLFSSIEIDSKVYLIEDCVLILLDKVNELIVRYSERPFYSIQPALTETEQ